AEGLPTYAKSFDTFCPLGPWIETEFDPNEARIACTVNSELRQDGNGCGSRGVTAGRGGSAGRRGVGAGSRWIGWLVKPRPSGPGALDVILAYLRVLCMSDPCWAFGGGSGRPGGVGWTGSGAFGVCGGLVGWAGGDERWARGVGGPVAG